MSETAKLTAKALDNLVDLRTDLGEIRALAADSSALRDRLLRAGYSLSSAFDMLLEAHGQAVLADHLAAETDDVA